MCAPAYLLSEVCCVRGLLRLCSSVRVEEGVLSGGPQCGAGGPTGPCPHCPVPCRGEEWGLMNSGPCRVAGPGSAHPRVVLSLLLCRRPPAHTAGPGHRLEAQPFPSRRPGAVLTALTSLPDTSPVPYRPPAGSAKAGPGLLPLVQGPGAVPAHSRCSANECGRGAPGPGQEASWRRSPECGF